MKKSMHDEQMGKGGVAVPNSHAREVHASAIDGAVQTRNNLHIPEDGHRALSQYTQQILDISLDAIVGMDAHGLITTWNPQSEIIFGWSRSEAIGRDLAETIIPDRHRGSHRHGFERYLASGESNILGKRIEITAQRRDGQEFPVELTIGAMVIDGEPVFIAFLRDITERKQYHWALDESEKRFRLMFEKTADALLLLDPEAGLFIDCNQAALDMLCIPDRENLASMSPADLSPPHQADGRASSKKATEMIAIAMKNGSHRFEWIHRSPFRDNFPVEVLLTPVQMADKTLVITTWRDITERKKAESFEKQRSRTLERIATGAPLPEILETIVSGLEQQSPGSLGSILLLDDTGRRLLTGAASSLPHFYSTAIHNIEIGEGVGSCGTAAFRGERVIVEDIQHHPYWGPFRDLAKRARLGACWSEPILSRQGRVLGTFAIYHHEIYKPTSADLELVENAASLASIAIEVAYARTALEQSEARFRLMADSAPVLIWLSGADGMYSWFNKVWLDFTGLGMEQQTGNGWMECIHPEDLERCQSLYRAHFERRQPFTMEYRLRRHDGEYRWVTDNGVPRFDSAGNFEGFIGSCIDISESKRQQLVLRESETKLRTLYETSGDAIMILDTDHFIDCNTRTLTMFACPAKEVFTSMHPGELSPPRQPGGKESIKLADEYIEQAIQEGSSHFEWVHKTFDTGRTFPADVLLTAMVLNGRKVVQATVRDISERKKSEEKLQLAASVFTHAREGIMITDVDGTIIDVNDIFTQITGYSREEVLGKNPRILSSGIQTVDFYKTLWHTLQEKKYWQGEIWNRRKNGEIYAVMLTIAAVCDVSGHVQHHVVLFTDITPMKENQKQLEHIAHYDALTSLPNRVLLADRLQQAMHQSVRRRQSLAVAYLDLDGFKSINDVHGHDTGDKLLIIISERMKEALREGDTLARIGGDEFVAVLVDIGSLEDCEPILKRLLQAAAAPVNIGDDLLRACQIICVSGVYQAGTLSPKSMTN